MNWGELLKLEIDDVYGVTERLLDMVEDDNLDWKPTAGENWMTTGQLLMHITNACGMAMRGFVTGDWGMPEGASPEAVAPSATKLPAVSSVAEAKELLAKDKQMALESLATCSDERFEELTTAPWNPTKLILGFYLLQMVQHLIQHKGQLFYYLKMQGKPVNTRNLW